MTDLQRVVHLVVPDAIDDPQRPSGGNTYDRRIRDGLGSLGWTVHEHAVPGGWPHPDAAAADQLGRLVAAVPDGAMVLVDGIIASCAPDVLVPAAGRLRVAVLVHLPLGHTAVDVADRPGVPGVLGVPGVPGRPRGLGGTDGTDGGAFGPGERRVLSAASAIVTTSVWTRHRLLELYPLDPARLHIAQPGVDAAPLAPGTPTGGELLCVAAVTPGKGHDQLVAALAKVADLPWRCVCAGSLGIDPGWAAHVREIAHHAGIADRLIFVGPLAPDKLDRAYAAADALVLASRAETYGMVITEALARGLPVIATSVGGLAEAVGAEAVGHGSVGGGPGLLVRAGDPEAFAAALRAWLTDITLRERLRGLARARRRTLSDWLVTARRIDTVLDRVAR